MPRLIVIPARWESSRFPGKPLALINGLPMIARVARLAQECAAANEVIVVTDDWRIVDAARAIPRVTAKMDRAECLNGTERVARQVQHTHPAALICVLQCDEPTLTGKQLTEAFAAADQHSVTTLAGPVPDQPLTSHDVTLDADATGNVTRFRRGMPALAHHHVGVYIASNRLLQRYRAWPPCPEEQNERLEQLRWFAQGVPLRCCPLSQPTVSVNIPADIAAVEQLLQDRWKQLT